MRTRTLAYTCFAVVTLVATQVRADWINLTGSETAPNIAEIYVLDDRVHVKLEVYVDQVGIAPLEVLRWATRNGAVGMGLGNELGTIAAGKIADLLVVRSDPTDNISILGDPDNFLAILRDGSFVKNQI